MQSLTVDVETQVDASCLFRFLKTCFQSETYHSAWIAARGRAPHIDCVDAIENSVLHYRCSETNPLTGLRGMRWEWKFELESLAAGGTHLNICYHWPMTSTFATYGAFQTVAAHDLSTMVISIEALAFERD